MLFISWLESPIEEVTNALYGKWRNFMMTHNLELKMPEILFDGVTFRITPRAFEGDGTLFKFEMLPKALEERSASEGRLFGLKKLSKTFLHFKSKCTTSATIPKCPLVNWLPIAVHNESKIKKIKMKTNSLTITRPMHKHNGHIFLSIEKYFIQFVFLF